MAYKYTEVEKAKKHAYYLKNRERALAYAKRTQSQKLIVSENIAIKNRVNAAKRRMLQTNGGNTK